MNCRSITIVSLVLCSVLNTLADVVQLYPQGSIKLCEKGQSCIKKCCPEKHVLIKKQCIPREDEFELEVFSGTKEISNSTSITFRLYEEFSTNAIFVNCVGGRVLKLSPASSKDKFYLQVNGSLYKPNDHVYSEVLPEFYCLDIFVSPYSTELSALVCYMPQKLEAPLEVHFLVGMIISMPFLLMTLLVYAILPETSLHRKALMCYVSSLLIGYMILVSTQLSGPIPTVLCHVLGYSIIFFFTVSFFWMNVMCLDMWWAFSGMRAYNGFRGSEMKRFLFYCLYAFGIPSVHVFFVFMLNTYGDKNAYYHPLLGEKKCYVEDGLPELLYFYLPMAFVIIVNIVLFILTTIKIRKVKRETAMLKHSDSKRHSYEDDKQKFQLYLKLLLAMGVNWSMEVISWAVTWKLTKAPTWIWYLTDFTNATYGAVIFFIFVFKKKIWISLKKRYYVWVGKPHLAHAMSRSTPGTRTSQFSTTDTGYDHRMSELKNTKEEERALN